MISQLVCTFVLLLWLSEGCSPLFHTAAVISPLATKDLLKEHAAEQSQSLCLDMARIYSKQFHPSCTVYCIHPVKFWDGGI